MAKTLRAHTSGIPYCRHQTSTGKLEGINNTIKPLKRIASGFPNPAFFILELHSLHKSSSRPDRSLNWNFPDEAHSC